MHKSSQKMLIHKKIKKGKRVIPVNAKGRPIAIAMQNFKEGDVGVLEFDIAYPVIYKNYLLSLPGLRKNGEKVTFERKNKTKTKRRKCSGRKQKKRKRPSE